MTTISQVCERWADVATGKTERGNYARSCNVFADSDLLYSYGYHFELGRFLRDRKGRPTAILLNGDRYSNSTTRHQGETRKAAQATGLPVVIIPHAAMSAAGIDMRTVRPLDIIDDRMVQDRIDLPDFDPSRFVTIAQPEINLYSTLQRLRYIGDGNYTGTHYTRRWDHDARAAVDCDKYYYYTNSGNSKIEQDARGYYYIRHRHILGESLIVANVNERVRSKCPSCSSSPGKRLFAGDPDCQTCYGRGIISRDRVRKNVRFLSGFDHGEPVPERCYFFCELPRFSRAETVAQAYEDLKPDAVRLAEGMGREHVRQGDIFAIPVSKATREIRKAARTLARKADREARLLGTNHAATEVAVMADGTTFARGILYHVPDGGRRRDHVRKPLGDRKTWHLIVKNTVPIAA